jgi:hypothetical protein
MGFETTIPLFERAKTVHSSDRATTVIGMATVLEDVKRQGEMVVRAK